MRVYESDDGIGYNPDPIFESDEFRRSWVPVALETGMFYVKKGGFPNAFSKTLQGKIRRAATDPGNPWVQDVNVKVMNNQALTRKEAVWFAVNMQGLGESGLGHFKFGPPGAKVPALQPATLVPPATPPVVDEPEYKELIFGPEKKPFPWLVVALAGGSVLALTAIMVMKKRK